MNDASEESFVEGPFAVGKTRILAFKLHWKCLQEPGSRCGFLRLTKESVKGSVIPTYYNILGYNPTLTKNFSSKHYVVGYGGENPQRFLYKNGSRIDVLGMNKPDDFLSTEFAAIGIPQAEEFSQDAWTLVARRTRKGKKTQVFGDVNPTFPQHFLNNSKHIARYKMTHKENPEYWDRYRNCWTEKGNIERIKLQRMTGTRYKRGYLGIWCAQEGAVYDMYDEEIHDKDMRRDHFGVDTVWNLSIDYGTRNPWAANFWASTPDGVHHHFKEIYRTEIILDEFIDRIRHLQTEYDIKPENVFADHDAEHNNRMEREGFPIVLADKNQKLASIELVKKLLEDGMIKFNINSLHHFNSEGEDDNLFGHPKCLRDELGVFAYRTEAKRTFTDRDEYPIEYGDHAMDSMQYYIKGMDNADVWFPISSTFDIGVSAGI